jgi:superfamily II DNA or RNA helicase
MNSERNNTDFPYNTNKKLSDYKYEKQDILQYQQRLVYEYFVDTKNRGILVFHGTGYGKTMIAVAIANKLKNNYKVIILSSKSLHNNFKTGIEKYNKLTENKDIKNAEYTYISSNASNMLKKVSESNKTEEDMHYEKTMEIIDREIHLNNVLLIVDEAHNFFNSVVNGSKNASTMYNYIMNAKNLKLVFLTATPIINHPFELVPLFNMLAGDKIMPTDYEMFCELFINFDTNTVKNKEIFKNRIYGLLSYMGDMWLTSVTSKDPIVKPNFPTQLPIIIEKVHMSTQQYIIYNQAREKETGTNKKNKKKQEINNMQKPKGKGSSYRIWSRQISNFLLPEVLKIKNLEDGTVFKDIINLSPNILNNLEIYSPKMKKIYENIDKSENVCHLLYSNFVTGEGLAIFALILKSKGWSEFGQEEKKNNIFAILSGEVDQDIQKHIITIFNNNNNVNGSKIRLLMISGSNAEGLDLRHVRYVHIMEPFWNYSRIEQVIARGVRYKSHDHLPESERNVQPYIYLSDYPVDYKNPEGVTDQTTDIYMYNKGIKMKTLLLRFYINMIEASIDCHIHKKSAPKKIGEKFNCLMCKPTNRSLYNENIMKDLEQTNPCISLEEENVTVQEIVFNNETYFYNLKDGLLKCYEYDKINDVYNEITSDNIIYKYIQKNIE